MVTVADTALKFEFDSVDLMLTGERRIAMARLAAPLLNAKVTASRAISREGIIGKIASDINGAAAIIQVVLTPFVAGVTGDIIFANMNQMRARAGRFSVTVLTTTSPNHRLMAPGAAACPRGGVEIPTACKGHANICKIPWIDCCVIRMLMRGMTQIAGNFSLSKEIALGHIVGEVSPTLWWKTMTCVASPLLPLMAR